ncbi:hypothetical protein D9619_013586 [Psilocybe cf. subviscida]|uniref:Pyridoxamine 5'-phosphate oxidase N-terminal domain-containing protein n=1 Tax=Psilocybe cf. subviscida TaxID=2480587 RepID=A0A8H5ER36_9AGAR|nr:hypothetical protein D9619_013586 [Psilocybe cf. subviscida]
MGLFQDELTPSLAEWMLKQQMFWVASAPLSADGHVNISPKGVEGTFHVDNTRRVWYEDLSGTGAETVAHIRENGRISILFHAFEGPARIVRLYGKGFIYEIGSPEYEALLPPGKRIPGSRAIIGLDITKVGTTCGYAVPFYQFLGHRTRLIDWAAKKEAVDIQDELTEISSPTTASSSSTIPDDDRPLNPEGMRHWWQMRNLRSLDGLPAFSVSLGKKFPFSLSFYTGLSTTSVYSSSTAATIVTSQTTRAPPPTSPHVDIHVRHSEVETEPLKRDQHIKSQLSTLLLLLLAFTMGIAADRFYTTHTFHRDHRLSSFTNESLFSHL